MPRFIAFAEPALSYSSVKEPFVRLKLSRKQEASKRTRHEKTTSIIFLLLKL